MVFVTSPVLVSVTLVVTLAIPEVPSVHVCGFPSAQLALSPLLQIGGTPAGIDLSLQSDGSFASEHFGRIPPVHFF